MCQAHYMLHGCASVLLLAMPRPRRQQISTCSPTFHHCVSRVVDRNFVFEEHERHVFRKALRQVEAFSGVRVITWTILSNHFHVLLEVPPAPPEPLSDEQILDRCRALYSSEAMAQISWEFDNAQQLDAKSHEALRQRFLVRMWNLSHFMKTLKQKFTV